MESFYDRIRQCWKDEIKKIPLSELLSNYKILFAYHSGRIENPEITYSDTYEIFENGKLSNFTGSLRTVYDIVNQKDGYDFLLALIEKKEQISLDLIKDTHRILTEHIYDVRRLKSGELPGRFKVNQYVVGKDETGAHPDDVEDELEELVEDVQEYEGIDHFGVAVYFHAKFENIHPFADGNGRVGRTLLNYYLLTHDEPAIVIRDEDKKAYYDALQIFDDKNDLKPLLAFMKSQTVKTWEKRYAKELDQP